MRQALRKCLFTLAILVATGIAGLAAIIRFPTPLFAYEAASGRLALYSDRPFSREKARAVLDRVEAKLETSPLDDHQPHAIFICNSAWRRMIFFNRAMGAAGINLYPLTNDVFLREADVDADTVIGASGRPAQPPRTLAYYAAHEITHSFTAEYLGAARLWNFQLPQWLRECYADYIGLAGDEDLDALYRRYLEGDAEFDWRKSGRYSLFRLLTAYMIERAHQPIERLLDRPPSQADVENLTKAGMAGAKTR